ncbi:unnamed protein product, partial [Mesorhabditis spiculigera]
MAPVCPAPSGERYERLPDYAKPAHYVLRLEPDFESFTFKGRAEIDVEILKPTTKLKLHAKALNIGAIALHLANGQEFRDLQHTYSDTAQVVEITLPVEIAPQKTKLSIDYIGVHNDHMQGFYRSKYTADGKDHWMFSTQFETTYARQAFPCWDEPVFKATYDVTLVVDDGLTALSNAMEKSSTVEGKKRIVKFDTSPLMSSYLVAFAVGKFEYLEGKTPKGTLVRIYTVPGKKEFGHFALEVSTKALDWYGDWFGIPYMMPKCDLIAIPDYSMGAMENWGLITFREIALLFDPAKTSTKQKTYVALVIAHELAHLWFGDLVTMKWWTDLWLKEGFASFMEYLFVGYNYPEMKIWLHFLNDELSSGFDLDSLKNSHPIEVPIENPNELDEIYDSITYAKSNSINRMLCFYLGEEKFKQGLRNYLQKFKYANAETKDLWAALSEASGQDVAALMSGWTSQMGFPVVSVNQLTQENGKRVLAFEQKRFLADGSEDRAASLWKVPITLSRSGQPDEPFHRFVLSEKRQEETVTIPDLEWLKVNQGTTGFYRVRYDEHLLHPLVTATGNSQLPVLDRFGLGNDLFALLFANQVTVDQALSFLEMSRNETEYAVWRSLDMGIARLGGMVDYADEDGSLKKRFDRYLIDTLRNTADRLGWTYTDGEDSQVGLLRGLIIGRICRAGDEKYNAKALELFHKYIDSNVPLHADLRGPVFGAAIRAGGDKEFQLLRSHYETCGFPEVERTALVALGQTCAKSGRLETLFDYAITQGKVRTQDLHSLFMGPACTRSGQQWVWDYFKKNLNQLTEKYGGVQTMLFQRCFKFAAEEACSEAVAKEVDEFFCGKVDPSSLKTLDRPIKQVSERIRNNVKLLKEAGPQLDAYLKSKGY